MKAKRKAKPTGKKYFRIDIQKRKADRKMSRKKKKENRAVFASRGKFKPSTSSSNNVKSGPSNKIKQLQAFAEKEKCKIREGAHGKNARREGQKPERVEEERNGSGFQMVTSNSDRLARLQEFVNAEARKMDVNNDEGKTKAANQKRTGDSENVEKRNLIKDKRKLKELREGQKQDTKEVNKLASLLRMKASRKKKVSSIFADDYGMLLQDIEEGCMSHKTEYGDSDNESSQHTSGFDKDLAVVLGKNSISGKEKIKSKKTVSKDEDILDEEFGDFEMGFDDSGVDEDCDTESEGKEEGPSNDKDNPSDGGDGSSESEEDSETNHCGLIDSEAEVDDELEESEDDRPPREDSLFDYQLAFEGGGCIASGKQEDIDLYSSDSQDDEDLEGFVVDDDDVEYESSSDGDSILDDKFDDDDDDDVQRNCKSESEDSELDASLNFNLKRKKKRKSLRISDGDESFETQERTAQAELINESTKDLPVREQDDSVKSTVKEENIGKHTQVLSVDSTKGKFGKQSVMDIVKETSNTETTDNEKSEGGELKGLKRKKKKKKAADGELAMTENEGIMDTPGSEKSECKINSEKVKTEKNEMVKSALTSNPEADENQDFMTNKKKRKKKKRKDCAGEGDEQNYGNVDVTDKENSITGTMETKETTEMSKNEELTDQNEDQRKKKKKKKSVTFNITDVMEEESPAKDIVQTKAVKKKKKTSVLKTCQTVDDESNMCEEELEEPVIQNVNGNLEGKEDSANRKRKFSEDSSENEEMQKRKKKKKRKKRIADLEGSAEGMCNGELLEKMDSGTSLNELDNSESIEQDKNVCKSSLTMDDDGAKSEDLSEDIYGRLRDKEGNVIKDTMPVQPGGKYMPPALRKLMALDSSEKKKERLTRLKRQLKGLLNRVAESNMAGIANQIESMYLNNSRNDLNETLSNLFMESLVTPVMTPERLTQEHSLLLAVLSANVGSEIGMHILNDFVLKWNDQIEEGTTDEASKELDNLLMFVCHLYNFKVVSAQLIYDILQKLAASFGDKEVELILLVLRSVGFTLRKDDPIALKLLITKIQNQALQVSKENQGDSFSRVKFMLEVVQAIKNNNMAKVPNYDPSHVEHLKKVLRGLIHKGKQLVELKISLDDLLESRERGRWWIVGSAWTGEMETDVKRLADITPFKATQGETEYSEKFIKRAAKLRMSRPPRVNILYIFTEGSHDFLDAFEKLLQLSLPPSQEQEIFNVMMICCLKGKQYNPFYAYLAEKMCQYDKKYKRLAQFALWDKFQEISELKEHNITNLAKFLSHLVADNALNLSVLKKISFMDADVKCISFLRQLLLSILLHPTGTDTVERVFSHLTVSPKLKTLRLSLRVFMLKFLKSKNASEDEDHQLLTKHTNIAIDLISSGIGAQL